MRERGAFYPQGRFAPPFPNALIDIAVGPMIVDPRKQKFF